MLWQDKSAMFLSALYLFLSVPLNGFATQTYFSQSEKQNHVLTIKSTTIAGYVWIIIIVV